jgi:hypothetical protein
MGSRLVLAVHVAERRSAITIRVCAGTRDEDGVVKRDRPTSPGSR